jgi:hypothetical protein
MVRARNRSSLVRRCWSVLALTMALALSLPARAGAGSADVTVTAQIAPVFSLTILTDGTVAFGTVPAGTTYTSSPESILRVESSLPWDFTDSSDTTISLGGSVVVPRSQIVRHTPAPAFGLGRAAGVTTISCVYTLDLTSAEALAIPPGTALSTRLGYTVVQQ